MVPRSAPVTVISGRHGRGKRVAVEDLGLVTQDETVVLRPDDPAVG